MAGPRWWFCVLSLNLSVLYFCWLNECNRNEAWELKLVTVLSLSLCVGGYAIYFANYLSVNGIW